VFVSNVTYSKVVASMTSVTSTYGCSSVNVIDVGNAFAGGANHATISVTPSSIRANCWSVRRIVACLMDTLVTIRRCHCTCLDDGRFLTTLILTELTGGLEMCYTVVVGTTKGGES
jgi:hypothetical protein